jgi:hypothetical protein
MASYSGAQYVTNAPPPLTPEEEQALLAASYQTDSYEYGPPTSYENPQQQPTANSGGGTAGPPPEPVYNALGGATQYLEPTPAAAPAGPPPEPAYNALGGATQYLEPTPAAAPAAAPIVPSPEAAAYPPATGAAPYAPQDSASTMAANNTFTNNPLSTTPRPGEANADPAKPPKPEDQYIGGNNAPPDPFALLPIEASARNAVGLDDIQANPILNKRQVQDNTLTTADATGPLSTGASAFTNTGTTTSGLPSGPGNIGLPGLTERYQVDQAQLDRGTQTNPGALTPSGDFLTGFQDSAASIFGDGQVSILDTPTAPRNNGVAGGMPISGYNTGTTATGLPSGPGNIGLPGQSERYKVDQAQMDRGTQTDPGAFRGNPFDLLLPLMQGAAIGAMGDARKPQFDENGNVVNTAEGQPLLRDTPMPGPADAWATLLGGGLELNANSAGGLAFTTDPNSPENIAQIKGAIDRFGEAGQEDAGANEWWRTKALPWLDTAQDAISKTENNPGYDYTDPGEITTLASGAMIPSVAPAVTSVKETAKSAAGKQYTDSGLKGRVDGAVDQAQGILDEKAAQKDQVAQILRGKGARLALDESAIPEGIGNLLNTPLPTLPGQGPPPMTGGIANALKYGEQAGKFLGEVPQAAQEALLPTSTAGSGSRGTGVASQEGLSPKEMVTRSGAGAFAQEQLGKTDLDERFIAEGKNLVSQAGQKAGQARSAIQSTLDATDLDEQATAAVQKKATGAKNDAQRFLHETTGLGSSPTPISDQFRHVREGRDAQAAAAAQEQPAQGPSARPNVAGSMFADKLDRANDWFGTEAGKVYKDLSSNGYIDQEGRITGQMLTDYQQDTSGDTKLKEEDRHPAFIDADGNWTEAAAGFIDEGMVGTPAFWHDLTATKTKNRNSQGELRDGPRDATEANIAGSIPLEEAANSGGGSNTGGNSGWVNYGSGGGSRRSGGYSGGGRSGGYSRGSGGGSGGGANFGYDLSGGFDLDAARSVLGPDFMAGFMDDFAFKDMLSGSSFGGSSKMTKKGKKRKTTSMRRKTKRTKPPIRKDLLKATESKKRGS